MAEKLAEKGFAEKKANFVLIDVRETDEIEQDGKIDGATNMPPGQLIRNARQDKLNNLKGKTICAYCNGGYRGNVGADKLNKAGFKAVTIEGGYAAWKDAQKKDKK